jgi:hypothetical protein
MQDLRMYCDGADTVIATSPEHATRLWENMVGEARSDHPGLGPWQEVPADKAIAIDVGLVLGGREFAQQTMTRTATEWIDAYGAGFLCSTEA